MNIFDFRTGPFRVAEFVADTHSPVLADGVLPPGDAKDKIVTDTAKVAALVSTALLAGAAIKDWSPALLGKVKKRYASALQEPTVMWTLAASQMAADTFPSVEDAICQLAIMDSESRFNPKALNPSKAYGLMQIIPSNVKHISSWPKPDKDLLIAQILPVINWVKTIDPVIAAQMATGTWPSSLTVEYPLWQLIYISALWREAHRDLKRYFSFSSVEGFLPVKKGRFAVKNSSWLDYMSEHAEWFKDPLLGKVAILANLWKHGAPRGLGSNAVLHYLNPTVDHISPIVAAVYHLRDATSIIAGLEDTMQAASQYSGSDKPLRFEDLKDKESFIDKLRSFIQP